MSETAVDGVKVLEYGGMISGLYCGKLLADLGAEAIRVEEPPVGDAARSRGHFLDHVPHPKKSGLFLYLNTNNPGTTFNLGTASGRQLFKRLAEQADILIKDRPPC